MCQAYLLAVQNCEFGELYLVGNSDEKFVSTFDHALNKKLEIEKLEILKLRL